MNDQTKVAVLHAPSYSSCAEYVTRIASLLNLPADFTGKKVLLKPNVRAGRGPETAINTHPEVVRAVIRLFKARGAQVSVGDSCGVYGFTKECFARSGLTEVIEAEAAELCNFDKGPSRAVSIPGKVISKVYLPTSHAEWDYKVTLPKLKTHSYTMMTGALKNQIGWLPGGTKARLHYDYAQPELFAQAIVDLNAYLAMDLAIMDGILAMEGDGPARGTSRRAQVLLAGADLAAVDVVACRIMGIDPAAVLHLALAGKSGRWNTSMQSIRLVGDDVEAVQSLFDQAKPKRSEAWAWLYKLRNRQKERSVVPRIAEAECARCGRCVTLCPTNAIELDRRPMIQQDQCIFCFTCYENCPISAIKLDMKPWVKAMIRKQLRP